MIRLPSNKLIRVGLLIAGLISLGYMPQLYAIGVNYFDDSGASCDVYNHQARTQICSTVNMRLLAGQNNRVPIQYVHAKAYFVAPTTVVAGVETLNTAAVNSRNYSIEISGADFCPTGASATNVNSRDAAGDGYYDASRLGGFDGTATTRFIVSKNVEYLSGQQDLMGNQPFPKGVNDAVLGRYRATQASCRDLTLTVTADMLTKADGLKTSSGESVWQVNFIARHVDNRAGKCVADDTRIQGCDGITNGFRIRQTSNATDLFGIGSVGPEDGGGNAKTYGVSLRVGNTNLDADARAGDITADYSLNIKFAPDCSILGETNKIVSVVFYDLDYSVATSGGQSMKFLLLKTDTDGSNPAYLGNRAAGVSPAYVTGNAKQDASRAGRWVAGTVPTTPANYRLDSANPGIITVPQAGANGNYTLLTFPANQGDKYELYVINVSPLILNQFSLPFSSIYYKHPCEDSSTYNLRPAVNGVTNGDGVEQGATVAPTASGLNTGTDTASADWVFSVARYDPSNTTSTPTTRTDGTSDANTFATTESGADNWQQLAAGSGRSFVGGSVSVALASTSFPIGTAPIGTRFCFFTSINQYSPEAATTSDWRHTGMKCVTVGRYPKVQIRGYDGRVGGDISTSLSALGSRSYGSWGEYGVLSDGINMNMASGAGLFGGSTSVQSDWSDLTFANLPQYGQYNGITPVVVAEDPNAIEGGNNVSLNATTYSSGDTRTIRYRGTLRINGNLRYNTAAYTKIGDLPRMVFIADNVVIAPGVTQIDPWIITNNLSTCSDVNDGAGDYFLSFDEAALDTTRCNNKLTFNGPVKADNVFLYRTAGSDSDPDSPAEVFNLRADAFLSSFAGGGSTNPVASTDAILEVPPRF